MDIKRGGFRPSVEVLKDYTEYLADGLVASNSVQRSAVVSVGTVATEILNKFIDPGYQMQLKRLQFHGIQQFTGLTGDSVSSLMYYWQGREEYFDPVGTMRTGSWMNLTGTYSLGIGTQLSAEGTLTGLVPVASISHAPVRVRLMAEALVIGDVTGQVNSASFIRLVGNVIPST